MPFPPCLGRFTSDDVLQSVCVEDGHLQFWAWDPCGVLFVRIQPVWNSVPCVDVCWVHALPSAPGMKRQALLVGNMHGMELLTADRNGILGVSGSVTIPNAGIWKQAEVVCATFVPVLSRKSILGALWIEEGKITIVESKHTNSESSLNAFEVKLTANEMEIFNLDVFRIKQLAWHGLNQLGEFFLVVLTTNSLIWYCLDIEKHCLACGPYSLACINIHCFISTVTVCLQVDDKWKCLNETGCVSIFENTVSPIISYCVMDDFYICSTIDLICLLRKDNFQLIQVG